MEDSTSATDRRTDLAISIERSDLEALIGEVVRREMAGQQAGSSANPPVGGEPLGVAFSVLVLPLPDLISGRGERAPFSLVLVTWLGEGRGPCAYGELERYACRVKSGAVAAVRLARGSGLVLGTLPISNCVL